MFKLNAAFVSKGMSRLGKSAYPRFRTSSSKNIMNPLARTLPTTVDFLNLFDPDVMPSFVPSLPAMTSLISDVKETDKAYEIMVDVPGVEKKDINISVRDNHLIISADRSEVKKEERDNYRRIERSSGHMTRSFYLPQNVHADHIEAQSENGVLHITLPKSEEHVEDTKKIVVK